MEYEDEGEEEYEKEDTLRHHQHQQHILTHTSMIPYYSHCSLLIPHLSSLSLLLFSPPPSLRTMSSRRASSCKTPLNNLLTPQNKAINVPCRHVGRVPVRHDH